jgi:beta-N-acetylhexosaminidase
VADRTPRREALERFILGFDGAGVPPDLAALLGQGLAGVAIYPRNFASPAGLRALTDQIRAASAAPVVIGIDQEGGTTFSLPPPFTAWPSPAELGRLGDAALVERVARAIAVELRAVGVNTDFAPMLDLAVNPESPVTRGRSFGRAPGDVARLGAAFLRGLAAEGVLGCAKHFPGHGDTTTDPHLDLPSFDGTMERLQREELVPFAAAIAANTPMIMTAHILLPQIDATLPASLSPAILEGILRRELTFEGVLLADDLGMGALAQRYGCGESAVITLEAGTDIAMLCHNSTAVPEAIRAVTAALGNGRFDPARWAAGRRRIATLRMRITETERPSPPLDVIGSRPHRLLADDVRCRLAEMDNQGLDRDRPRLD